LRRNLLFAIEFMESRELRSEERPVYKAVIATDMRKLSLARTSGTLDRRGHRVEYI